MKNALRPPQARLKSSNQEVAIKVQVPNAERMFRISASAGAGLSEAGRIKASVYGGGRVRVTWVAFLMPNLSTCLFPMVMV